MTTVDLIKILVGIALIWFGWQFADPYWDKYWLTKDIEKTATYATKRDIESARVLLTDSLRDYGTGKTGQDCYMQKDDRNVVSIRCEYDAKVAVFGYLLHTYHIKIAITKREEFNKFLN
jgi:hypothetical protein